MERLRPAYLIVSRSVFAWKDHEAKIDEILDKISRGGMKSLSASEKKFLRDASERMNRTKH
jgi:uncharacterized protein (DUF779 family)